MTTGILLVEDEEHLAFALKLNLEEEGYHVFYAENGKKALELYAEERTRISVVLLDLMLPEIDGFQVAKSLRLMNRTVAILMITARAQEEDRLKGLALGVDDYITKPFHLKEVLLKVERAATRATFYNTALTLKTFEVGGVHLDYENLTLKVNSGTHVITTLEADILREFLSQPDSVLTTEHLLSKVWGVSENLETRTVDAFISRIRKLIEADPASPQLLVSVRGRGYKFRKSLNQEENDVSRI